VSPTHVVFDESGEVVEYQLRPLGRRPRRPSTEHDLELRALVGLAWERRGGPDYRAALEAIEDWHDRRHIRAFERRQRSTAAVLQVLRDIPDRRN
jgi:hypothetical protein